MDKNDAKAFRYLHFAINVDSTNPWRLVVAELDAQWAYLDCLIHDFCSRPGNEVVLV